MAARAPRRSFARPFVITLAATPACFTASSPPPQETPRQPPTTVIANPPHPTSGAPAAPPDQHWTIVKTDTGCEAIVDVSCPHGATCNPPPPQKYDCPNYLTLPAKIETFGDGCILEREPMQCPKGAMCNPPPPQKVPCPK